MKDKDSNPVIFRRVKYGILTLACKQGKSRRKSRGTSPAERPNQMSFKHDCPMRISFRLITTADPEDACLVVTSVVLEHKNHPLTEEHCAKV